MCEFHGQWRAVARSGRARRAAAITGFIWTVGESHKLRYQRVLYALKRHAETSCKIALRHVGVDTHMYSTWMLPGGVNGDVEIRSFARKPHPATVVENVVVVRRHTCRRHDKESCLHAEAARARRCVEEGGSVSAKNISSRTCFTVH